MTALEFALVAPVFFLLLFSILEIALITFSTSTFRTGLAHASRLVRTGQAQCMSDKEFVKALCSRASFSPDCAKRTSVERKTFPVGYTTDASLAVDADEFKSLGGGEVVMVRATYRWPVQSPVVEPFFADSVGDFAFSLSFLFKNEEFAKTVCK